MNKRYLVTDTGAGYNGKMFSIAAKHFGLKCKVFMGHKDFLRQKPNVDAMRKNGAEIVPVYTGSQTLVDAVSEVMRYWVANHETVHLGVGLRFQQKFLLRSAGGLLPKFLENSNSK